MKRKVSGIVLIMLLGVFMLAFDIQPIKAFETIYIRADGSIDPPTAPISTVDNVLYTFADNIYCGIVIERNNIVVDGAGYTLQGSMIHPSEGIDLSSRNNVTIKNMTIRNFWYGIYLNYASKVTLIGNNITANTRGIQLSYSLNNSISGNNITGITWAGYGVNLVYSSNNNISENKIASSFYGISLGISLNNSISRNNIANNQVGIELRSSNNNISGNNITGNNQYGITLIYSSNNNISENLFVDNGLMVWDSYGNMVSDNQVNGKPLVYLEGVSDVIVEEAGQVVLIQCNRIQVKKLDLSNATVGVELWQTNNTEISENTITATASYVYGNLYGIALYYSSNNNISGNTVTTSEFEGILLCYFSNNNSVSRNTITMNGDAGISLVYSSNNSICRNKIANNSLGIELGCSSNNSISENSITNNSGGVGFGWLGGSSNNIFSENYIANNFYGINLYNSSNNNFSRNHLANNLYGIRLHSSSNNNIYHNNFIKDYEQVYIETPGYPNSWDNDYPSGGNYWSDYEERYPDASEIDNSGIWDTPYTIDGYNQDRYPTMKPWPFKVTVLIAGKDYVISMDSNTSITNVVATPSTMLFTTSGTTGTIGYINITIPIGLNKTKIKVFVDGVELTPPPFPIITSNGTHYFVYFEFTQSIHDVTIQYAISDIAITSVMPSKTIVGQGYSMKINVTVANKGNYTETFVVTVYAGTINPITISQTEITLTSGNSTTITFTWNTSGFAKTLYEIMAIADTLPGEMNILDNTFIVGFVLITKVGDFGGGVPPQFFNCDDAVDGKDLALFLQCYKGLAPPEAMYLADLGGGVPPQFFKCDGIVDGKDLALFLRCYKGLGPSA